MFMFFQGSTLQREGAFTCETVSDFDSRVDVSLAGLPSMASLRGQESMWPLFLRRILCRDEAEPGQVLSPPFLWMCVADRLERLIRNVPWMGS